MKKATTLHSKGAFQPIYLRMKKTLLLAVATLLLTSCVTSKLARYIQIHSVTDFRPFTENGFFISPGMEGVSYKPIGLIRYTFSPGVKNNNPVKKKPYSSYYEDRYDEYGFRITDTKVKDDDDFFQPDEAYITERVVEYAKTLGATGLLNYKITYSYEIPSVTARLVTEHNGLTILKPHPDQRYGEATVTAFAVEIIE